MPSATFTSSPPTPTLHHQTQRFFHHCHHRVVSSWFKTRGVHGMGDMLQFVEAASALPLGPMTTQRRDRRTRAAQRKGKYLKLTKSTAPLDAFHLPTPVWLYPIGTTSVSAVRAVKRHRDAGYRHFKHGVKVLVYPGHLLK